MNTEAVIAAYPGDFVRSEEHASLMAFYRSFIGSPGCAWDAEYPDAQETMQDLLEGRVLCLRAPDRSIAAAISLEEGDADFHALKGFETPGRFLCLARLGVRQELQGRGLARALFLKAYDLALERGYGGVRFIVHKGYDRAIRLYDSLGCQRVGEGFLYGMDWYCYEKRACPGRPAGL